VNVEGDAMDETGKGTETGRVPARPWTFDRQKGVPGHCFMAQVWGPDGAALAQIEPTDDPRDASAIAAFVAHSANAHDSLVAALRDVAEDVCGMLCPSAWRTEDGRPPCHPKCQAIRAALEKAR
jgi:hypothetical protein